MATANPIDKELYSLATANGESIPLDVIRPLSVLQQSWGIGASAIITIPVVWKLATFFSERGCFIQFNAAVIPATPLDNIEYADTLFVPPNIIVTSTILSGNAKLISYDSTKLGKVTIQQIQKWSGLALKRQVSKL